MDGVTLKRDKQNEHVAEIVLDRPEALNALSTAMARRLGAVCAEVAADGGIRAVVLSASGDKAFCVGADLKERNAMTDAEILAQRPVFRAAFGGVLNLPQPVVAAVHGYALGGGCEFALSCDMIVADESAVFGLPEVSVGLLPGGGGTQLALRKLGSGRAADLVLTGRRLAADEAAEFGLVDRLVPRGEARAEALAVASLIARNSPTGVRAAKRAMRLGGDLPLEAALDVEENAWRTVAFSPDRREGIAAFNEKRKPNWPDPS
ncbi:enoyl-CoA hydratase/isomerase family protein [Actinomadura rupiterrae]|uniref:enoyl-CoA hydratase/isomerase family protein n=1 Tax=Actinomadura rupiterrae TaxID=559627 RepID=UPI0020A2E2AF|nr:enoyl-CoA hydratase-related protein [Actinomadura rupiterrae]MCP2335408.1 enoyl-CoA hydratase/carnithine racemase [Actinomadura rupiterrae]